MAVEGEPDETWVAAEALARTMGLRPGSTLERRADASLGDAMDLLGRGPGELGVELGDTLGQGGMGIVRRARQPSLDRDVAVKTVRPDRRDPGSVAKVLQEAWVLARLDHPNIVAIHDIRVDADGVPQILMKRVEGVAWSQLLDDPEEVRVRFDSEPLEWHLRTTIQVCHAIAYAHDRGILHLDLKPENVMIGAFGEVYVMDWGIALALDDDAGGRIPLAADCAEVLGTPSYMAPELLEGDGRRLGRHTDVYLLGATLHELVTGEPPHRGSSMMNVVHDILTREPRVGSAAPPELAALIDACLARDPSERPADVDAVRLGIERFLQHRGAALLEREADERRRGMEALLEDAGSDVDDEVYELFGACRFAYSTAMERWPENPGPRDGLAAAAERLARWELQRGRPEAAASVVASVQLPLTELRGEVDTALASARAREERLKALAEDLDPAAGQRTRLFISAVLGVLWIALPFAAWLQGGDMFEGSRRGFMAVGAGFFLLASGLLWWGRESMRRSAINRGLGGTVLLVLGSQLLFGVLADPLALSLDQIRAVLFTIYLVATASLAIMLDRRFWPAPVAYAVGLALVTYWPAQRDLVLGCCNIVLLGVALRSWMLPLTEWRGTYRGSAETVSRRSSEGGTDPSGS